MQHLPISGFPIIEPEDADQETVQRYAEVQRETDLPFIPIWAKIAANSPPALDIYMDMWRSFNSNITLPQSIVPMILYCIATARNCIYCSVTNGLYCRTLGVDEETLVMLANDLENVSPKRLRAIIQFALKCAFESQQLVEEDYEKVRQEGISDDELAQIIFLAALANFNDTLADSFKIEVEPDTYEALKAFVG
jgi:alkylhydroperoxidase family enzyme